MQKKKSPSRPRCTRWSPPSDRQSTDLVTARGRIYALYCFLVLFPEQIQMSSAVAEPGKEDQGVTVVTASARVGCGGNGKADGRTKSASASSLLALFPLRRSARAPSSPAGHLRLFDIIQPAATPAHAAPSLMRLCWVLTFDIVKAQVGIQFLCFQ